MASFIPTVNNSNGVAIAATEAEINNLQNIQQDLQCANRGMKRDMLLGCGGRYALDDMVLPTQFCNSGINNGEFPIVMPAISTYNNIGYGPFPVSTCGATGYSSYNGMGNLAMRQGMRNGHVRCNSFNGMLPISSGPFVNAQYAAPNNYGAMCTGTPGSFVHIRQIEPYQLQQQHQLGMMADLNTKYVGKMRKLGRNFWWQKRFFTIDGGYFCCFEPQSHLTPHFPAPFGVDCLIPGLCGSFYRMPKWVIPIQSILGIYTLERTINNYSWFNPSNRKIFSLAASEVACGGGVLNGVGPMQMPVQFNSGPCSFQYRWINLIRNVGVCGGMNNYEVINAAATTSVKNTFMIADINGFHILRAKSSHDLINWLTILYSRWLGLRGYGLI